MTILKASTLICFVATGLCFCWECQALPLPLVYWCSDPQIPWDRCGIDGGERMMEDLPNVAVKMPSWWESVRPYARQCLDCTPIWLLCPLEDKGAWDGGSIMRISSRMMLEVINKQQWLLPGYELMCHFLNEDCQFDTALKVVFGALNMHKNQFVGIGASGCSGVSNTLASMTFTYNMPIVSWASGAPDLSERSKFRNFFRTVVPHTAFTSAWIAVYKIFGWSDIAVVMAEEARFRGHFELQKNEIRNAGLTVAYEAQILDPLLQTDTVMTQIKRRRLRIIQLLTFENTWRAMICSAWSLGMKGLVWMVLGVYSPGWYATTNNPDLSSWNCGTDELREIGNGAIFAMTKMWTQTMDTPLSCDKYGQMTPQSFKNELLNNMKAELTSANITLRGGHVPKTDYGPASADGACLYAQALSAMLGLHPQGLAASKTFTLQDLQERTNGVYEAMNQLFQASSFNGVGLSPLSFKCELPQSLACDSTCRNDRGTCTGDLNGATEIYQFRKDGVSGDSDRFSDTSQYPLAFFYSADTGPYKWTNAFQFTYGSFWGGDSNATPNGLLLAITDGSGEACVEGYHLLDNPRFCAPDDKLPICPAGKVIMGEFCQPCSPGTMYDSLLKACRDCPAGSSQPLEGQTECEACSTGRFSNSTSDGCESCAPGYFADSNGMEECRPCAAGHFSDVHGQWICSQCDIGFYSAVGKTACVSCPGQLSTRYPAAESSKYCACAEGSYRDKTDRLKCNPCPPGLLCPFGSDQLRSNTNSSNETHGPLISDGHMALFINNKLETFLCQGGRAFCAGARQVFRSAGAINLHAMCAHNATGIACAQCLDDGVRGRTTCRSCDGIRSSGRAVINSVVFAVQSFIMSAVFFQFSLGEPKPLPVAAATLLSFSQTILLVTEFSVEFPHKVQGTLESSGIVNMDLDFLRVFFECSSAADFMSQFILKMTWPIWLWMGFAAILLYSRLLYAINVAKCCLQIKPHRLPASLQKKIDDALQHWYPIRIPDLINAALKTQSGLFIVITSRAASIFRYRHQPSGQNTLVAYPEILDQSPEWWNAMPFSLCGLALFSLGFLAVYAYLVAVAPLRIGKDPTFQRCYRGIWEKFHPAGWWFGIIQLLYGLGLNLLPVISRSGRTQLLAGVLLSFWYLLMLISCRAWKCSINLYTDLISKSGIVLFILMAFTMPLTEPFQMETTYVLMISSVGLPAAVICISMAYDLYYRHINEVAGHGKRVTFAQRLADVVKVVGAVPHRQLRSYAFHLLDRDVRDLQKAMDTIEFTMLGLQTKSVFKRRCAPIPYEVAIAGRLEGELLARGLEDNHDARVQLRSIEVELRKQSELRKQASSVSEKQIVTAASRLSNLTSMLTERHLTDMFASCDQNSDGTISKKEFVATLQKLVRDNSMQMSTEDFVNVFEHIDVDQDGFVTPVEFFHAMSDIPDPVFPPWFEAQSSPELQREIAEDSDAIEPSSSGVASVAVLETPPSCEEPEHTSTGCEKSPVFLLPESPIAASLQQQPPCCPSFGAEPIDQSNCSQAVAAESAVDNLQDLNSQVPGEVLFSLSSGVDIRDWTFGAGNTEEEIMQTYPTKSSEMHMVEKLTSVEKSDPPPAATAAAPAPAAGGGGGEAAAAVAEAVAVAAAPASASAPAPASAPAQAMNAGQKNSSQDLDGQARNTTDVMLQTSASSSRSCHGNHGIATVGVYAAHHELSTTFELVSHASSVSDAALGLQTPPARHLDDQSHVSQSCALHPSQIRRHLASKEVTRDCSPSRMLTRT